MNQNHECPRKYYYAMKSNGRLDYDKCDRSETMNVNEVKLGGCYHDGVVYAIGYLSDGDREEIELDDGLFTNLDTGLSSNAMAALIDHRRQFNPNIHVERFIVALKPVKIVTGVEDNEDYKLGDNAVCDFCGTIDRLDDNNLCDDCVENDTCDNCNKLFEDCHCYCDNCDGLYEGCSCEYIDNICDCDDEFISDTFKPMNAFARARFLSAKEKSDE